MIVDDPVDAADTLNTDFHDWSMKWLVTTKVIQTANNLIDECIDCYYIVNINNRGPRMDI
jgi:hypothetical protein